MLVAASGSARRRPTVVTLPFLHLVREQRDRAKLDDIAAARRPAQLIGKMAGQRDIGVVGGNL